MPKLSAVLRQRENADTQTQQDRQAVPEAESSVPVLTASSTLVYGQKPAASAVESAIAALEALHRRRIAQHGPRQFRHADGSLLSEPPPRNPYTVVGLAHCCLQTSALSAQ